MGGGAGWYPPPLQHNYGLLLINELSRTVLFSPNILNTILKLNNAFKYSIHVGRIVKLGVGGGSANPPSCTEKF